MRYFFGKKAQDVPSVTRIQFLIAIQQKPLIQVKFLVFFHMFGGCHLFKQLSQNISIHDIIIMNDLSEFVIKVMP